MKISTHFLAKAFKELCFYTVHHFPNNLQNMMHFIINSLCKKCFTVEHAVCVDDIGEFAFMKATTPLSLLVCICSGAVSTHTHTKRPVSGIVLHIFIQSPKNILSGSLTFYGFAEFPSVINVIYTRSCASFATSVLSSSCSAKYSLFLTCPKSCTVTSSDISSIILFYLIIFRRAKRI